MAKIEHWVCAWTQCNLLPGPEVVFFAQNSHDNLISQPVFSGKFFTPLIYNFGMRLTLPTDFLGISKYQVGLGSLVFHFKSILDWVGPPKQ